MHARTSRKPNQADQPPATERLVQQRRTRCHHFLAPNCSAWCPRSAPAHFAMHARTSRKPNQADHLPAIDRLIQQRRTRCHQFLAPNWCAWCPRSAPAHFAMHARTSRKLNQGDQPLCHRSLNPAAPDTVPPLWCHNFLAPNCSAWCPRSAPAHFAMQATTRCKLNQADHPPATDRLIQQRRTRCHHFLAPNCCAWCPRARPRTSLCKQLPDASSIKLITPCHRSLNPAAHFLGHVVPAERARHAMHASGAKSPSCRRSLNARGAKLQRVMPAERARALSAPAMQATTRCKLNQADHPPATDRLIQQRRTRCLHFLAPNCCAWCPSEQSRPRTLLCKHCCASAPAQMQATNQADQLITLLPQTA